MKAQREIKEWEAKGTDKKTKRGRVGEYKKE